MHAIRAGQPLQFHSCFISFSTADESFAHRIHNSLEREGVRCWFAPEDMKAGRKLHDQIVEAIQFHDKLLLILSPASMKSEWVKEEILNAWTREKREKRSLLFPVALCSFEELRSWKCFDADTGRDVAHEIREHYVPTNFGPGEATKFERAFKKLCAALLKAAATIG